MTDPAVSPAEVPLEGEPGAVGADLAEAVNKALGAELPPGVTLAVLAGADGRSITLDCATGIQLDDSSGATATAALLLQLSASIDDAGLRIGLVGEYDDVHVNTLLPTAGLEATELVASARALVQRVTGFRELLQHATSDQSETPTKVS